MPEVEEFYVGYKPQMPPGIAARTGGFVLAALVLVPALAALFALGFRPLPSATFEFGQLRSFEGTLAADPYPALLVDRPGETGGAPEASRYHLVAPFKFGAQEIVRELAGRRVRLEGSLVHRDGQTLVEVVPDSLEVLPGAASDPLASLDLGEHLFVGEIVDSKCFLGVMNPGNLKPHRACAIRCISGGIPPVLCVRDGEGVAEYLLLVGEGGEPLNADVLEFVALPVEVRGRVERLGDQLVLRTTAADIRRIDSPR